MQKIVNTLLIILIIISVIEIGYLLLPKININLNKTLKLPSGVPTKTTSLPANAICPTPTPLFNPNDSKSLLLNQLKNNFQGNLISSILSNKFQGKITSITAAPPGKQYKVEIVMLGKNNNSLNFFFNDNDLRLTSVSETINGKTQNISLNNLKAGDQITIESTVDLTKNLDNNAISITITKL